MKFISHNLYHVYNQGNNKQEIFHTSSDYECFLTLTLNYIYPVSGIIAYCFMPNHFHFLLVTDDRADFPIQQGNLVIDPVTNGFRKLLSSYARIYNKKYQHTGSVFRQKTKAKQLSAEDHFMKNQRDYYFNCFHYIHQNPLKAGLVKKLEDWNFSSFKDYAELRESYFIDKVGAKEICGYDPRFFVKESYMIIERID